MKYTIEVRPLATIEIIDAYNWYELQREGLGIEYLNALEIFYTNLPSNPYSHSYYTGNVRHGKLDRFPYSVVYEIFETTVVVYSVFMAKQEPSKKRIR